MIRVKADEILKIVDPIIGVAGKGAEVTFNLAPDLVEVSISDESESIYCRMCADVHDSTHIEQYNVDTDIPVTVNIDRFTAMLRTFGSQMVDMSIRDRNVIIENDTGRRTLRMLDSVRTSREVNFNPVTEISADPAMLKRFCMFESISDSMFFRLHSGRLSIGCTSESETAEIYIEAGACMGHTSYYSSEIMSDLFKRIHTEGDGVTISLADDMPLMLKFSYDCATFYIFVAPRIDTV